MAEEFVDIEQNGDPLGILSKKTVSPSIQEAAPVDSDPLGILKKKSTPVVSSGIPSQLPSQPDFLQQGQKVASGEIFTDISKSVPKPTLKQAAIKDRGNNNSYLGAVWNNIVASAERLAGGAARLAMKMDTSPVARIQETADKAASSVTGINYEAIREKEAADKFRNFIGKARTASSSKEYEKGLSQGFDVTDGIGLDDLKGLGAVLPSMLADMALAAPTAGTSFAIQGYDDALSTLDDIPEAKNMSETTRTAFGLGGGVIAGVLEKLGMDNILKSGTATRYVTSKILKEASEEIAKKGVKVTAEQFQKAVADKATQMLTKTALKNTVKAGAKSALTEGATEATQEGAMDLLKLASNQLEGKEIFDEEEIKNTAASRYLNSAVMGGIFGGVGGAAMSRTKNVQRYIQNEIKNAKTQQDIDNLVNDINQNVQEGVLSKNDAEVLKSMVDENISKPSDLDIKNEKETKLSEIDGEIALLNKEDRLYNENLEKLNKRKEEVNSYYDNLAKESKKVDEVVSDDGTPVPMEESATEVEVTEEVKPTEAGVDLKSPEKMNASQNRYGIVKEGKDAGFIVTSNPKDGVVKVQGVTVNEDLRGKGLAGEAYVKLGNDLAKEGISLASDSFDKMEPSAKRVWDKLVDRGLAEKGENNYELKKPEAEVKPTEVKSVEQLRADEQAELDSRIPNAEQYRVDGKVDRTKLTNEEDIKAFDEVYNKYDKLISPLLEKPAEQKITVELLSSQEPPQKEGETIVTLSGKTEKERLESIERRQSSTKVTDYVLAKNKIVQDATLYFKRVKENGRYKNTPEGRAELNDLRLRARELGFTVDTERDKVTMISKKTGRPTKVSYDNTADSDAVVESSGKTLTERSRDVQDVFEELTDAGVFLDIKSESGNRMSAAQIDAAVSDILEGIPSKAANKYLDALEKGLAEDAIPLYDKGMGGFAPSLADIRAQLGIEKEVVGEPMDEAALNKFLDEESKLTPEEEQDLLDNVENLLYEYETTEAGPEGKVQPTEAGAKERVPSEAKPSEPTKSERQAEYEKIKSNKKKKDFVRNNLPEEFKPLADELTEAQMSEIVDSNFDLKTIKNIQDAVQKQSAAEVLQRKQEGDGGTGGGRKRVEQGKQGDEPTGEGKAKAAEEAQPKGAKEGKVEELKTNDKSILKRITGSENISDSVKEKFKDDLKYEVKSKEEAKSIAKNIIKEYGTDDAVTLAEANKFHGDVNSFIFSEAINDTYIKESEAKTPEEKLKYAEQWADYAIRFDESARSKGRFISAISDFYKKSPLGIKFVENERRNEDFKKWYKAKEGSYKEVFDELVQDPKFKSLIGEEVQKGLKEERAAQRQANRKKIEDFFENAKLKGNNLYAVPIPPKVINGALEIMKQSVLAGESVVNAVNKAIEHISKEVKDWDKEKFRKEYETKLSSIEGKAGKREKEELPEDAKNKILDKFRKKLKGLDESQKEQVIRKSFKQLVENGALEYNDFKKIIAETIGYGEVTPEEAAKITKLVSDINSVDDLAESIRNEGNRSEQNLLKYQKAKKEAEKSATELNKMVYNKTNVANRLLSIMQLNTLGIPSLVNNPIFNIWNQATVRFPNAVSMTVLDQILYGGSKVSNKLFGTGVLLPENNVLASQKEFFKKALQGGKLSTEQLFTGLTNKDYFQKEIYSSQIHPFTSIKDLWNWKFNGKSLTPAQVVDKSIQATVGLPAEIVARALNIGDKPQRFAAEGAQAAVFAKNLGLKDIDYKYFLEFPKEEAYRAFKKQGLSDDVAMKKAEEIQERIIKQGEESTFQQENLVNEVINSAVNIASSYGVGAGGVVKAIKTLNMPFLKIPLNASWSVYNLANPQVAFLQSAIYGARAIKSRSASDIQQSKKWLAHGATGIALTGIAGALVSNGIINASNRSDETSKKERQGEKTYEQQNSINVTKLGAYLRGENPDDVKNSLNVDLKWFGNVGNILNIEAIKKEEMTPEQRENGMSFMEDMFSGMSISSMELIENGVFSNTSGLLTAIDKGGNFADSYVLNLINMGTNIVQPAMFAQMSRAQLPYYSQQKADTFMEQLKNNLLTRSSVLRSLSDKYPPSQIGVWGDRLDRKDNVAMKLFGISSNNNDNFAQPIYNDYKKTNNTAFLPPAVKPEVNGFELNVSQTNKLETLVGQARKNLAAPFVNDGAKLSGFKDRYSKLSEEDKAKALGIIYKMGYQVGEKQFTDLYPEFYKSDKKTPEQKKESKESSIFRKSLKKLIK
jgi:predicted GNAT family acetyltransferase